MNVSKLTDVELNRAMIWLNPRLNSFIWTDTGAEVWVGPKTLTNPHWSYLLNWNLTMPLAVDNELNPQFSKNGLSSVAFYHTKIQTNGGNNMRWGMSHSNKNPLRAICEVLVMIALEKK